MKLINSIPQKELEAEVLAINDVVKISRKAKRKQRFKNMLGMKRRKFFFTGRGNGGEHRKTGKSEMKAFSRSKRAEKTIQAEVYKSYGLSS